jgi:hypothetical protein
MIFRGTKVNAVRPLQAANLMKAIGLHDLSNVGIWFRGRRERWFLNCQPTGSWFRLRQRIHTNPSFGHDSMDVTLANLKGKDAGSK